jgi:hypothetical protein
MELYPQSCGAQIPNTRYPSVPDEPESLEQMLGQSILILSCTCLGE